MGAQTSFVDRQGIVLVVSDNSSPAPQPAEPNGTFRHPSWLEPKSAGVAYGLLLITILGVAGIQHFYLGKVGRGILWLLTWGVFGIGTIIDLFTLPSQTKTINARRAVGIR